MCLDVNWVLIGRDCWVRDDACVIRSLSCWEVEDKEEIIRGWVRKEVSERNSASIGEIGWGGLSEGGGWLLGWLNII